MIYLLYGPDRFLVQDAAQKIALELDPSGANTSRFDGREASLESIIAAVGSASFFGDARLVIVTDLLARGSREAAATTDDATVGANTRNNPSLARLVAATPDHHHLMFLEPTILSTPAALKAIAPAAKVIPGEPPRGAALIAWIVARVQSVSGIIDRRVAQLLAETLFPQTWDRKPNNPRYDRPPDLALLAQEIEKLTLSAYPDPISTEHIVSLVSGAPDQRLFRFLDAAITGDLRTAAFELDQLGKAGEDPAMLLAQALGQIELAAIVAAAGHRDSATIAHDLGSVNASRVSAISATSRRVATQGSQPVATGVSVDRRLKTGRLRRPADALHDLIAERSRAGGTQQSGGPE